MSHKDCGPSSVRRHNEDVTKIRAQFIRFDVFNISSDDLICITTGDVANSCASGDINDVLAVGKLKMKEFVDTRLIARNVPFHDAIKTNKITIFGGSSSKDTLRSGTKNTCLKADRNLMRRLVVAMESGRDIAMDSLLCKELHPVPISLMHLDGNIRIGVKSQLAAILESDQGVTTAAIPFTNSKTCIIIDAMALIQAIGKPPGLQTFGDLADNFARKVTCMFSARCTRIDIVFDRYNDMSIKDSTRC